MTKQTKSPPQISEGLVVLISDLRKIMSKKGAVKMQELTFKD